MVNIIYYKQIILLLIYYFKIYVEILFAKINIISFSIFNFYQSIRREDKSNITIPYQIIFFFYLRINFFFIY